MLSFNTLQTYINVFCNTASLVFLSILDRYVFIIFLQTSNRTESF